MTIFKRKSKAPKLITNKSKTFKGFALDVWEETTVGHDKLRSVCINKVDMEIKSRFMFIERSIREELKSKF